MPDLKTGDIIIYEYYSNKYISQVFEVEADTAVVLPLHDITADIQLPPQFKSIQFEHMVDTYVASNQPTAYSILAENHPEYLI